MHLNKPRVSEWEKRTRKIFFLPHTINKSDKSGIAKILWKCRSSLEVILESDNPEKLGRVEKLHRVGRENI